MDFGPGYLPPENYGSKVIHCRECRYWDQTSGLTARKCERLSIITVQHWYWADGGEIDNDKPGEHSCDGKG